MENSICIIGVYFGPLRKDFNIWLKSCASNPTVDFLIVTDNNIAKVPSNVKVLNMTLEQLRELSSLKLGLPVALYKPYKCCDLKPFYGKIFEEQLNNFEYWGHCDFDLVFGDLRNIFEKYEYRKYDHFLGQGHLALYKNRDYVTNYAKLQGGDYTYQEALSTEINVAFDELDNIGKIYIKNNLPMFKKNIFADLSPIYTRLRRSQFCWIDKAPKNFIHQIFIWENGHTYQYYLKNGKVEKEEVLYIHYQKRTFDFTNVNEVGNAASFIIKNDGYEVLNAPVDETTIKKYSAYVPIRDTIEFSLWYGKKISRALSRRIKKINTMRNGKKSTL